MSVVTYRALDQVLRSLGFTCRLLRREPEARWYEHAETRAIVSLPMLPEDEPVFPSHLAAVRGTLELYGISDSLDFAARLQEAS